MRTPSRGSVFATDREQVLSDAMLDDILGPLVLYDLYDGEVELLSATSSTVS